MSDIKENMFLTGSTGSGKTYYFQNTILPRLFKDDRQIILLDMKGEYKDMGVQLDINDVRMPFFRDVCCGKYTKDKDGKPRSPKLVTVQAPEFGIEQVERIYYYLCHNYNKAFVMEEASFFFEDLKHKDLPRWTKKFIRTTCLDHNNNNVNIVISQSPQDIPKIYLGQFGKGYIFKLKPFQLKYLYENDFLPHKPEYYKFGPKSDHKMYTIDDEDDADINEDLE